jgi:hypothetical protein
VWHPVPEESVPLATCRFDVALDGTLGLLVLDGVSDCEEVEVESL